MTEKLPLPKKVTVCEVAPRDGFQAISTWIPTDEKIKIIRRLAQTGISSLEIASFVHPRAIPQMKDADKVVSTVIESLGGIDIRALVPNLKGAERAVDAGVMKLKTMLSATDSHSLSNANATSKDAQQKLTPIFDFAAKKNVTVMGSISVAFGCPFEGKVPVERLIEIISRYDAMGVKEISLADTTGMAHPKQVYESLAILQKEFPEMVYSMHFHNTRGMALANTLAALQRGVTRYDSAISGLGGCPYAPGASGNVATEDVVHMLEEMNIKTGINERNLLDASREISEMLQIKGDSYLLVAGPTSTLHEEKITKQKKVEQ
ncbi:hydroxymethylglutaryl-CoA lyase [Virgibacillus sp. W0430]|uniref:hydroxymethylglutaryl-CoA lyase n=1 Tax=Virgibacillus sp. W0430 TaxID=3391580 RepID=UPI003F48F3F8